MDSEMTPNIVSTIKIVNHTKMPYMLVKPKFT